MDQYLSGGQVRSNGCRWIQSFLGKAGFYGSVYTTLCRYSTVLSQHSIGTVAPYLYWEEPSLRDICDAPRRLSRCFPYRLDAERVSPSCAYSFGNSRCILRPVAISESWIPTAGDLIYSLRRL